MRMCGAVSISPGSQHCLTNTVMGILAGVVNRKVLYKQIVFVVERGYIWIGGVSRSSKPARVVLERDWRL